MFRKLILFFSLFLIGSEAWVARGSYKNDAHPGKCYINANLILSPGEVAKSPGSCSEIHCSNANGAAQIIGCIKVAPPENCEWNGLVDVNAAFPLCCLEKYVCNNPSDVPGAENLQNHLRVRYQQTVDEKQHK